MTTMTMTTPMSLPKGCKPSRVLSTDKDRPAFTHAYVKHDRHARRWELHGTDSYIAVRLPLTGRMAGDKPAVTEGYVPVEVVKQLDKGEELVAERDVARVAGGEDVRRPRRADFGPGQRDPNALPPYPNFDLIWPVVEHQDRVLSVGVDAEKLYRLARALGVKHVALELDLDRVSHSPNSTGQRYSRAIPVKPLNKPGGCYATVDVDRGDGLLMPTPIH